jgi:protein CpxP
MNNTSTNNFWKWFALLLVVLNITCLIFLTAKPFRGKHNGPEHRMPMGQEGPARFIIQELGFTNEQAGEFEKLKLAHHDSILKLQESGRQLRNDLFEGLKTGNDDNAKAIAQQIANNQMQIEMATYRHFEAVKKLCTPEQQEKFNDIIQEVLKRMAPGGPMHQGPMGPHHMPPPGEMHDGPPGEMHQGPPGEQHPPLPPHGDNAPPDRR